MDKYIQEYRRFIYSILEKYSQSCAPQNIFLVDASFAENIAFGVPNNEIDPSKG